MSDRLGDLLVAQGVVDAQQIGKALALQKTRKIPLGEALVSLGLATEDQVWRVLARQHKLPFVDLVADAAKGGKIRPDIVSAVPEAVAAEQAETAMNNIEALLASARMTKAHLVKLNYYLTRPADAPTLADIRRSRRRRPAPRTCSAGQSWTDPNAAI